MSFPPIGVLWRASRRRVETRSEAEIPEGKSLDLARDRFCLFNRFLHFVPHLLLYKASIPIFFACVLVHTQ